MAFLALGASTALIWQVVIMTAMAVLCTIGE